MCHSDYLVGYCMILSLFIPVFHDFYCYLFVFSRLKAYFICLRDEQVGLSINEMRVDAGSVWSLQFFREWHPDRNYWALVSSHLRWEVSLSDASLVAPDILHSHSDSGQFTSHFPGYHGSSKN